MRKDCDTCLHDEFGETYCNDCYWANGKPPTKWEPAPFWAPDTNADRIRCTDDVELMNRIYELHVLLSEFGHYELAEQFCDCKAECHDGEDCSEDRVKECIMRWLQRSAEES